MQPLRLYLAPCARRPWVAAQAGGMTNMTTDEEAKGATFDAKLNEQIMQTSKMHYNLAQDVIITTEDKVRLCIFRHVEMLTGKGAWVTPVSLFFTFATVITTA